MLVIASDAHKPCTTDQSSTKTANVNILQQIMSTIVTTVLRPLEHDHDINTA